MMAHEPRKNSVLPAALATFLGATAFDFDAVRAAEGAWLEAAAFLGARVAARQVLQPQKQHKS